jgi:hypothetical protein
MKLKLGWRKHLRPVLKYVYTDIWPEELRRNTASISRNNLQDATKEVDLDMEEGKV